MSTRIALKSRRLAFRPASVARQYQIIAQRAITTNTPQSFQNASASLPREGQVSHSSIPPPNGATGNNKLAYLETLNTSELISYGAIGFCTLNKPILDLVIKLFPYTPMFLVKRFVSKIYCGGETIAEVMETGERLSKRGIKNMMLSLSIEACDAKKNIDIDYIVKETQRSVDEILFPHTLKMIQSNADSLNDVPPAYIALKPTGLVDNAAEVMKHYNDPKFAPQFETLVKNCSAICETIYNRNQELHKQYPDRVAPFVVSTVDAEAHPLQQGVYELQRRLYQKFNPVGQPISVIGTIQMYLKESGPLLETEQRLAQENGYRLGLKLVRGAYIHSEPNRGVIHDSKKDTDVNYDTGISKSIDDILSSDNNGSTIGHLVVASHNAESQYKATVKLNATLNPSKANVVLAQLLGMADDVTFDLIENHNVHNLIKYVPWGPPQETKEYMHRRLEENGDAVRSDNGWPLLKGVIKALFSKVF